MLFKTVVPVGFLTSTFLAAPALAFSYFNGTGTELPPGEDYYTLSNGKSRKVAGRME